MGRSLSYEYLINEHAIWDHPYITLACFWLIHLRQHKLSFFWPHPPPPLCWRNTWMVLIRIITKIGDFLGLVYPRIPDDGVGEVVLLDAHFPARHHVGDDVLRGGVGVYPISVLPNHYYISTFLKNKQVNNYSLWGSCAKSCLFGLGLKKSKCFDASETNPGPPDLNTIHSYWLI